MTLKDADALLEYLMINMGWQDEDGREVDDWDEKRGIIKDLIDGVPTVDAVPVVRCKDCKYAVTAWENGKRGYCCTNNDGPVDENCLISPDWFCADGDRRDDE